jgi:hypothetical protein
VRKKRPES